MNRSASVGRAAGVDFADRLALTSRDRSLESMVLLEILRSTFAGEEPDPQRRSGDFSGDCGDKDPVDDPIFAHARNIAFSLCEEYGIDTLERRMFMVELAVEMAQRIADDLTPD